MLCVASLFVFVLCVCFALGSCLVCVASYIHILFCVVRVLFVVVFRRVLLCVFVLCLVVVCLVCCMCVCRCCVCVMLLFVVVCVCFVVFVVYDVCLLCGGMCVCGC